MNTSRMLRLAAVMAIAIVAAGSGAHGSVSAAAPAPETIRVATNDDQGGSTPFQNALNAGMFEKAGIHVEVTSMKSGPAIAAAIAGGAADFGKSSLLTLVIAHVRGIDFQIVAPAGLYQASKPDIGLFVTKTSSIRSAKDLAGKTIAVSGLGGLFQISAQAWLEKNGVDPSTVRFLEVPTTSIAPAVLKGTVDAGALANLAYQQALDLGSLVVLAPISSALGNQFLESAWFGTAAYIDKHRDLVTRFERVIRQADTETNKTISRAYFQTTVDPADVQPIIDSAAKYNVIPKPFPAQELISSTTKNPKEESR